MSVSKKPMEKRLQSERRKELRKVKSKEAARHRRGKEGEVFSQLIDTLPVPEFVKGTLDKTSIIKLCINYIRLKELLQNVWPNTNAGKMHLAHTPPVVDISHDFVLILSPQADIIYITENVKKLLGICQYDIIGAGLDMFIHPSDCSDMEDLMKSNSSSIGFTTRFKSSLASKNRVGNVKATPYQTVRFSGQRLSAADVKGCGSSTPSGCLVLTGTPVEHAALTDQLLDSMAFTCKHALDMQLTECDASFTELTRYPEAYAREKSFYEFIHPGDMKNVEANFKSLYSKEMVQTDPYRLLTFGGGYVRVVTVASILNDPKTGKPEHIMSIHHVISQIEDSDVIMADVQLLHRAGPVKAELVRTECCDDSGGSLQDTDNIIPDEAENDEYDSIFYTTAGCFMDVENCDIMADTESVFEPARVVDLKKTLNTDSTCCSMAELLSAEGDGEHSSITDLDALVAQLDNDYVDMTGGFFLDLPELADDEDLSMRAPYIPSMDVNDLSMVESCYAEKENGEQIVDSNFDDITLVSSTRNNDWCTYRLPNGSSTSSSSSRDQVSIDLSPNYTDTSSPWQIDTQLDRISPIPNQTSPYRSHDHSNALFECEQVFSPRADISRRLHDRLVVTTDHSPTYKTDSQTDSISHQHQMSRGERGKRADYGSTPTSGGTGYTTSRILSPTDQQHYAHTQRKRKASHLYNSMDPVEMASQIQNIDGVDHQHNIRTLQTKDQMGYSHSIPAVELAGALSVQITDYQYDGGSAHDSIEDLMAVLECPAKRSNSLHSHDIKTDYDQLSSIKPERPHSLERLLIDPHLTQNGNKLRCSGNISTQTNALHSDLPIAEGKSQMKAAGPTVFTDRQQREDNTLLDDLLQQTVT